MKLKAVSRSQSTTTRETIGNLNNVAVLQMLSAAATQNQNSTPIEIDGQDSEGCCTSTPVTINRTFPICLNDRVSQFSWTQFCEEVDVA